MDQNLEFAIKKVANTIVKFQSNGIGYELAGTEVYHEVLKLEQIRNAQKIDHNR